MAKLIFCKLKDEKDGTKNAEPYRFQIGTHETPAEVFARIDKIYQEAKKIDGEVFKENIKVRPEIVYGVAEHLQSLALNKIDLDTKGLAFERFMQDYFKGKMGQYFTPRPLVDLAVSMIAPKYDELVLDHACGSGGFLLYSLNAIRAFAEENYEEKEAWDYWHKYARNNLYGIEINEQIARVCKMNMILHDDGHTNIVGYDALKDLAELRRDTGHEAFKKDGFHIVLTNPPFGAKLKSSQHPYLESFVFGQHSTENGKIKPRKQQKSEIIFLERLREFLKPDIGRCAIILPDGILTNDSLQSVRNYVKDNFQILAVVGLPELAFKHYGAGVKASILFLRKRAEVERPKPNEMIFMATPEHIGYTSTGRDDRNDLPEMAKQFHLFQKNQEAWIKNHSPVASSAQCSRLDSKVLSIVSVVPQTLRNDRVFAVRLGQIDGALNAERYRNLWRETAFRGQIMDDIVTILVKKVSPMTKELRDIEWDLVRIDDLPDRPVEITKFRTSYGSDLNGSFYEVQEGDILYARLGPTIQNKKIIVMPKLRRRTLVSSEFLVLRCKNGVDPWAVFAVLKTSAYRDLIYSKGRGGTPSRYRLIRQDFLKLPFPKLSGKQSETLSSMIQKNREHVIALLKQVDDSWCRSMR